MPVRSLKSALKRINGIIICTTSARTGLNLHATSKIVSIWETFVSINLKRKLLIQGLNAVFFMFSKYKSISKTECHYENGRMR